LLTFRLEGADVDATVAAGKPFLGGGESKPGLVWAATLFIAKSSAAVNAPHRANRKTSADRKNAATIGPPCPPAAAMKI